MHKPLDDAIEQAVRRSDQLVDLIAPYLEDEAPEAIHAVLVDLAARWVLSHVIAGEGGRIDAAATAQARRDMLNNHCEAVAVLVAHGHPPPIGKARRDA